MVWRSCYVWCRKSRRHSVAMQGSSEPGVRSQSYPPLESFSCLLSARYLKIQKITRCVQHCFKPNSTVYFHQLAAASEPGQAQWRGTSEMSVMHRSLVYGRLVWLSWRSWLPTRLPPRLSWIMRGRVTGSMVSFSKSIRSRISLYHAILLR